MSYGADIAPHQKLCVTGRITVLGDRPQQAYPTCHGHKTVPSG